MKFIITQEKNGLNYIEKLFHWFFHNYKLNANNEFKIKALELFVRYIWNKVVKNITTYVPDSAKLRY